MSDKNTTIKYLNQTGLEHLTDKIEATYAKKSKGSVGQVLTTVVKSDGTTEVAWADPKLPDEAKEEQLKVLYGGNITLSELQALSTANMPTGFFYSVYNSKAGDVYSGNFTYDGTTLKEGSFLKWNGAKWVYDEELETSNFKSTYLYSRSYGTYAIGNPSGSDNWACIWQWTTTQMQKCGVTFVVKAVCSDTKKGFTTKFTIDSRSTDNSGLPYSYIQCEYLTPQTQENVTYWGDDAHDLRTFIRVTADPDGTYRVYSRMFPDMNGMTGVDLIYPTWSVEEEGFKNPIAITGYITWENHAGTEITKINYGLSGGSDSTKADLVDGKVPASQLPSYVDDVLEGYLNGGTFYESKSGTTYSKAYTGETGKIYVDVDTNKSYRWSGSAYIEISSSITVTDTYSSTGTDAVSGKAVASAISQITHPVTSVNGKTGAVSLTIPDTTDLFQTRGGTWMVDGDFNTLTTNGTWMCNSDAKSVNRPSGAGYYGILNVYRSIKGNTWDFIEQTYLDTTNYKKYFRYSTTAGSTWGTWREIADESQHKTYETINNVAIVKLGSFQYPTGTNDARFAGSMFSVSIRDNTDNNTHGILVVKYGRYSSDGSLARANGCEFIRLGSSVAGASGVEFHVDTTTLTTPVIYAKFTKGGYNRCYITPIHNASSWTWYNTAVEALPESNVLKATEKSFALSDHTHSNYLTNTTAVGSSLTPIYLDTDGTLKACEANLHRKWWFAAAGDTSFNQKYIDFMHLSGPTTGTAQWSEHEYVVNVMIFNGSYHAYGQLHIYSVKTTTDAQLEAPNLKWVGSGSFTPTFRSYRAANNIIAISVFCPTQYTLFRFEEGGDAYGYMSMTTQNGATKYAADAEYLTQSSDQYALAGHTHSNYVTTTNTDYYKSDRGLVSATTDWNTLTEPGSYKVQIGTWGAADTYHSPNSVQLDNGIAVYAYGILSVFGYGTSDERRIMQIYYPHSIRGQVPIMYRMRNASSSWNEWGKLQSAHNSVRKRGMVINDTASGHWYKMASFSITGAHGDVVANLLIDSGFMDARRHTGILQIRGRASSTAGVSASLKCTYLIAPQEDISSTDTFYNDWTRLYYTNDETNGKVTYDLWFYVKTQYQSIAATVLSEHSRSNAYANYLTVYENPSNGTLPSTGSGIGYVSSTNMVLGNTVEKANKDAAGNVISTTYVKKSGDSMSGPLYIDTGAGASSYNQGLRIGANTSNGWALMHLGDGASNLNSAAGWTLGRRGSTGSTTGVAGDFIIEYNNSQGTGLTLYKNGDNPKWNNKTLVTGSGVGNSLLPTYVSSTGAVTACADTINPYYLIQLSSVTAGYWSKLATITCNPGNEISSTRTPAESFMCFDVVGVNNGSTNRVGGKVFFNNTTIYYKTEHCLSGGAEAAAWWSNKFGIVYDTTDSKNVKIHLYGYHQSTWGCIGIRRNHTFDARASNTATVTYDGYCNLARQIAGVAAPSGLIQSTRVDDISQYLPLSGGTMTGSIVGKTTASNWYNARDAAGLKFTFAEGYTPHIDIKTTNGDWAIGHFNSYTDRLLFGYVSDTNYGSQTNSAKLISFTSAGGVQAATYNVNGKCTMQYNATTDSIDFVW